MKLCIDCRHYRANERGIAAYAKCTAVPATLATSPIDGTVSSREAYCTVERGSYGESTTCGPDARLFEAKDAAKEGRAG